jgi:hypothetical protein
LDKNQTSANVVSIQTHIKETSIQITASQKDLLESIISRLSNAETISAMGGNEYDKAKAEIQAVTPYNLRVEVGPKFAQFELGADNLDDEGKYNKLSEIFAYIKTNAGAYDMDINDVDTIVQKELCNILLYYNIAEYSQTCSVNSVTLTTQVPVENLDTPSTGGLPGWLKVILRIIGGGIVVVGGMIVFFAVRAKMKADEERDEDETEE